MEERSAGDADSGWGRKADEVRRINHAVKVFNGIYEEMYNMVNDAYVRNGYEKMGKRRNYFPHFQIDFIHPDCVPPPHINKQIFFSKSTLRDKMPRRYSCTLAMRQSTAGDEHICHIMSPSAMMI